MITSRKMNDQAIMKALSLHQPWASMIAMGSKTIETRTWPTRYRGELLIASTKKPEIPGRLCGFGLCVVNLVNCRKMILSDEAAARCAWSDGLWAWVLSEIREIQPFRVRGQQGLYEVEI